MLCVRIAATAGCHATHAVMLKCSFGLFVYIGQNMHTSSLVLLFGTQGCAHRSDLCSCQILTVSPNQLCEPSVKEVNMALGNPLQGKGHRSGAKSMFERQCCDPTLWDVLTRMG